MPSEWNSDAALPFQLRCRRGDDDLVIRAADVGAGVGGVVEGLSPAAMSTVPLDVGKGGLTNMLAMLFCRGLVQFRAKFAS